MSSSKNLEFKQQSFLNKSNSQFIEEMYVRFIENDPELPDSWKRYFSDLNEDLNSVTKEITGPTWGPKKISIDPKKNKKLEENLSGSEKEKVDSIKAIALIRAYRIRGHLIANLDPLGLMKRDYLYELHPNDHGFKSEDFDRKIYLNSYMDVGYATVNEIITKLRKVYCSSIGAEYMHITNPTEKVWFRERMEKDENQINFTEKGKDAILNKIIPVSYTHLTLPTKKKQ